MANPDEEMPLTLPDTQNAEEMLLTQSQELTCTRQIIWGRLCPNKSTLKKLEMSKDSYTLGRNRDCDLSLTSNEIKEKWVNVISKVHFRITRRSLNNGDAVVYLEDLSHNGTFVNKALVGKGRRVLLQNNDTISLAQACFDAYIYMSTSSPEINSLPPELRAKYAVSRILGSGACGEVKLVFTIVGCERFAMKTIAKKTTADTRDSPNDPEKVMNEVRILKALRHPCIIRVEEIVDTPRMVYIVLELMEGGELFDRIRDGLPERVAKFIFYQVVLAVDYLHKRGITHRDLKPENILLANNSEYPLVKVSDFGLSKFVGTESLMQTFCGTPMYVAPEILVTSGRGAYTSQVDVWSLGVILYVSLTGRVPFAVQNCKISLHEQIVKGMYRFPPATFANVSDEAKDLIRRMMTTDPKKRITVRQVLLHPWLQDRKIRDAVNTMTRSNEENTAPNKRENTLMNTMDPYVFDEPAPHYKRMRRE